MFGGRSLTVAARSGRGIRFVEDAMGLAGGLGWPIDNRPQVDNLPHSGVLAARIGRGSLL